MTEDIMVIMFLLIGAMAVCIVWLFFDVRDHKNKISFLETDLRHSASEDHELWKAVDRCEERIAKMDATIHETPRYSVTTEVNGNA